MHCVVCNCEQSDEELCGECRRMYVVRNEECCIKGCNNSRIMYHAVCSRHMSRLIYKLGECDDMNMGMMCNVSGCSNRQFDDSTICLRHWICAFKKSMGCCGTERVDTHWTRPYVQSSPAPQAPPIKCKCGTYFSTGGTMCDICSKKYEKRRCKCGDILFSGDGDMCVSCNTIEKRRHYEMHNAFVFYEPVRTYGLVYVAAIAPEMIDMIIEHKRDERSSMTRMNTREGHARKLNILRPKYMMKPRQYDPIQNFGEEEFMLDEDESCDKFRDIRRVCKSFN